MDILNKLKQAFDDKTYVIFCSREIVNDIVDALKYTKHVEVGVEQDGNISYKIKEDSDINIKELNIVLDVVYKIEEINNTLNNGVENEDELNQLKALKEKYLDTLEVMQEIIGEYIK